LQIYALTDALNLAIGISFPGCQTVEFTNAISLMKNMSITDVLLADKRFDANALFDWLG